MEVFLFTFTLWPIIGLVLLRLLTQYFRFADRPLPAALARTQNVVEILIRMYLWPFLVFFILCDVLRSRPATGKK